MRSLAQRLLFVLLALCALLLSGCTDKVLTDKTYEIVGGLRGLVWEPGPNTTKACPTWDAQGQVSYHWGVFYPPGYNHPGIANYTVCFTAGLNRENMHHGTVGLHEAGHLYFRRLREKGHFDPSASAEERYADCFSRIFGGQPVGIHYGCTTSEENTVRNLISRWKETGAGWL